MSSIENSIFEQTILAAQSKRNKVLKEDVEDTTVVEPEDGNTMVIIDPDIASPEVGADESDEDSSDEEVSSKESETHDAEAHIGDFVLKCPICGNNFFSCDEVDDEDDTAHCPVCDDEVTALVIGKIDAVNPDESDEAIEDIDDAQDEIDDAEEDIQDAKDEIEDEEDEDELVKSEESVKYSAKANIYFEEKVMNKFLTKFITDNYDNARRMTVTRALDHNNHLVLECLVVYKNGKHAKTKLVSERVSNLYNGKVESIKFNEIGFLTEKKISKTPSFTVEAKITNNAIIPTRVIYDYTIKEGKNKYQVVGRMKAINE